VTSKTLLLTLMVLALTLGLPGAYKVTSKVHTPAVAGNPEQTQTSVLWMTPRGTVVDNGAQWVMTDLNAKKITFVNHDSKTYVQADLPLDFTKLMPPEMAGMMAGMMKQMTISLKPLGETQTIGKWSCKAYELSMTMMGMPMKGKIWATRDLPGSIDQWLAVQKQMMQITMNLPAEKMADFAKLDGYPVLTEMSIMGMNTKTEVVDILEADEPSGLFTIPAGYQKQEHLNPQGTK